MRIRGATLLAVLLNASCVKNDAEFAIYQPTGLPPIATVIVLEGVGTKNVKLGMSRFGIEKRLGPPTKDDELLKSYELDGYQYEIYYDTDEFATTIIISGDHWQTISRSDPGTGITALDTYDKLLKLYGPPDSASYATMFYEDRSTAFLYDGDNGKLRGVQLYINSNNEWVRTFSNEYAIPGYGTERIHLGMTRSEAESILGKPTGVFAGDSSYELPHMTYVPHFDTADIIEEIMLSGPGLAIMPYPHISSPDSIVEVYVLPSKVQKVFGAPEKVGFEPVVWEYGSKGIAFYFSSTTTRLLLVQVYHAKVAISGERAAIPRAVHGLP